MESLKRLRKANGLTQEDLGQIIGVTKVTISCYENGTRQPTPATLKKLAEYFGVTVDELLNEKGAAAEKLPPAEPFGRRVVTKPVLEFEKTFYIPLVATLRCGYGHSGEPFEVIKKIAVPASYKRFGENIVAVTAKGDSMAPTIAPGSYLVCTPGEAWEDGNIVAVDVNDADTIKRIFRTEDGGIRLVPDNPAYKEQRFSPSEIADFQIRVLGRVRKSISLDL